MIAPPTFRKEWWDLQPIPGTDAARMTGAVLDWTAISFVLIHN